MAAAREGDDGEKSAFRWLDAARYVVSAVVIVLIVAVVAKAIQVVLRPDKLDLSLPGSSVYTRRIPSRVEGDKLVFSFSLHALNPSGRARMYYSNVIAYLFDNNTPATTPSPGPDSLIFFNLDDMAVPEAQSVVDIKQSEMIGRDPTYISLSLFDALNRGPGARINDATMRVDGTLVTESMSGYNTTPQLTTYYCRHIIVGSNPEDKASMSSLATSCTTS